MSFNLQAWNSISRMTTVNPPIFFSYNVNLIPDTDTNSADTLATITASGFFNDQADNINQNDLIYIEGSDAAGIYKFSSANGVTPVTVTNAISTNDLASGSVTLAKLASGIAPAYIVKYAGQYTTVAGSASQAITVTGVTSTDFVFTQLKTAGATPRTILTATPSTNTVTVVMSGDPSTDHVLYYQVLRAAA